MDACIAWILLDFWQNVASIIRLQVVPMLYIYDFLFLLCKAGAFNTEVGGNVKSETCMHLLVMQKNNLQITEECMVPK